MQRLIYVALIIFGFAHWAAAQTLPEFHRNEIFAGYSFNSADINTLTVDPGRTGQHGVNLGYTRNINKSIGLVGDVSAHFHRDSIRTTNSDFTSRRDQYYFLGGVQFKVHHEGRLQPFARALAGAALFRGFTSDIRTSGNNYTIDDASSFALAIGGGLDLHVNKQFDVRLIQADYSPTFFGSGRQDNFRLSVGVVFKH